MSGVHLIPDIWVGIAENGRIVIQAPKGDFNHAVCPDRQRMERHPASPTQ